MTRAAGQIAEIASSGHDVSMEQLRIARALRVRKPASGTPSPNRVPLPKPAKLGIDVVQLLLEERLEER